MFAYIVRRVLATIPVMAFVALFVFSLLYIAPGDPPLLRAIRRRLKMWNASAPALASTGPF
jgi:ABC-type dipeptide/oligopeptide/nickel transport system permease component